MNCWITKNFFCSTVVVVVVVVGCVCSCVAGCVVGCDWAGCCICFVVSCCIGFVESCCAIIARDSRKLAIPANKDSCLFHLLAYCFVI